MVSDELALAGVSLIRREHVLLDACSIAIALGEIVAVTEPSGAGKTALLRTIARLVPRLPKRPTGRAEGLPWSSKTPTVALGALPSPTWPWSFRLTNVGANLANKGIDVRMAVAVVWCPLWVLGQWDRREVALAGPT